MVDPRGDSERAPAGAPRAPRSAEGAEPSKWLGRHEADAAAFALADLHVGQLRGRDDDLAALLIDQGQQGVGRTERLGYGRLDLVLGLARFQHELSRGVLDTDPDLHRGLPFSL